MNFAKQSAILGFVLALFPALRAGDFDVVVTEIHYHPFGVNEASLEFVELHNRGETAVDLAGWRFAEGLDFMFTPGMSLEPGAYLVVSPDTGALQSLYPWITVVGNYEGRLDNSGEVLSLENAAGEIVSKVHFRDGGAWSSPADGDGPSLELLMPGEDIDRPQVWKSSLRFGGTPGEANSRGPDDFPFNGEDDVPTLRINEVLPGTGPEDPGYIELWNGGGVPLDLAGYVLVSFSGQAAALPFGAFIGDQEFTVLSTGVVDFIPIRQGRMALLGPDGSTFIDTLEVEVPGSGYSRARVPDGDSDAFVASPTPGAPNAFIPDDRVVIHEIFFAPRFEAPAGACVRDCSDGRQWIELHNRSGSSVDLSGWSIDKAVTHVFGPGTEIPAGGFMVVAASPPAFQGDHPVAPVEPAAWTGSLGRREDAIILRDALGNRVDRVHYGNGNPWNDESPEDGIDDGTIVVSDWPAAVSDSGRSIELVNPWLENAAGRAWRLGPVGGTPGAPNAAAEASPPPVIRDVSHYPPVPGSSDSVSVTCRAHAVSDLASVELIWRVDSGGGGAERVIMLDDGNSGDGLAGDSLYGGFIPPRPHRSIIGFQVVATSIDGASAFYPIRPAAGGRTPYYLYEVDDQPPLGNGSVDYRIIMTAADLNTLRSRPVQSDVLLNATFIGDGIVHHLAGIRYRGENTRNLPRKSLRIQFPPEKPFQGIEFLNLNASNRAGSVEMTSLVDFLSVGIFRRAGMPYMQEWQVNLHFMGGVLGNLQGRPHDDPFYIRKEHFNRDFLSRYYGGSDQGNLYRALDPQAGVGTGNLSYQGENPGPYARVYEKRSNRDANDYSDLIELTRALDRGQTPDSSFVQEMYRLVDTRQWAMFFAIEDFLTNNDGGIQTNNGEDYYLYHVPRDSSRIDAGLWVLLPWDLEETFTDAQAPFFITQVDSVRRFLRNPEFAPLYLEALEKLRDDHAKRALMRESAENATRIYAPGTAAGIIAGLDNYVTRRIAAISDRIVPALDAGVSTSSVSGQRIIAEGDTWRYLKGTEEPSPLPLDWAMPWFEDGSWSSGPSGFGYGDGDDATVLDDMRRGFGNPGYMSLYIRRRFDVPDPAAYANVSLVMDYDDAFVAYLNGFEIARSDGLAGAGGVDEPIPHDHVMGNGINHEASRGDNNPIPPETYPIAGWRSLLVQGSNVLAIQGFNSTSNSGDFSLIPELIGQGAASVSGGGWGSELFATGPGLSLEGKASGARAASVLVNGVLADVSSRPPAGPPYGLFWRTSISLEPGANYVVIEAYSGPNGGGVATDRLDLVIHRLDRGFRQVSGSIPAGTVWTRDEGPYVVSSAVNVPAGATLRVEAGTQVLLGSQASISVDGVLEIEGTPGEPVGFRPFGAGNRWGGIVLGGNGAAPHRLSHVELELGGTAPGARGCLAARGTFVIIDGATFRRMAGSAIDARDSRVDVTGSSFEDVGGGIQGNRSVVNISGSILRGIMGSGDGISLSGNGTERSRIEGCLIEHAVDDGIELTSSSVDIVGNVIRFAADRGCSIGGDGALGVSFVSGNLIHGSGAGLEIIDGFTPASGEHDTLAFNRKGLVISKSPSGTAPYGVFHSMIIWGNGIAVEVDPESAVGVTWSDVGGSTAMAPGSEPPWPGEGNILAPPLFLDVPRGIFGLSAVSPCRGTGKDGTDMGAGQVSGPGERTFFRGDTTSDGLLNLTDAIVILNWLFLGAEPPSCQDAADTDDNGLVNVTDAIYLLNHLYLGFPAPPPPYDEEGRDPTPDELGCD